MDIKGKVVIVTGAGSGIGAALTRELWKANAKVVLAGRRGDKLRALAVEAPPDAALCVSTDVSVLADLQLLHDAAISHFGAIDMVINNAGIAYGPELEAQSPDEIERQIAVNLTAPIHLTRLCLPDLKQRPEAMIVNVASMAGLVGLPCQTVYAATKFGLRGFGASLRRELLQTKVGVMTVYPSTVETEIFSDALREQVAKLEFPVMSAEHVAKQMMQGISSNTADLVVCAPRERLLPFIDRWFPGSIDRLSRTKARELAGVVTEIAAHSRRRDIEGHVS